MKTELSAIAKKWLTDNCLILDTETTGLGDDAEVVEISVIDATGQIVFNSLIRPTAPIPAEATAIHGISNADVADAPSWAEVHQAFCQAVTDRTVVIYNADYDVRLLCQTAERHGLSMPLLNTPCAMLMYAEFYGEQGSRGGYRWQRLSNAARQCGVEVVGAHRATADCIMTLGVIRYMAES